MIGLENKSLSQASLNQLAVYQSAIDEKRTYTEQIELAGKWRDKTNNRIFKEVKEKLISMCTNRTQRCMYCEDSASTDIEHFAPKSIYPNLTFVWDNYLYACSGCNSSSKGNKFAIFRTKDGVFEDITPTKATVRVPPVAGNPVLINPREEDPLHFLELDILGSFYFRPITKNEASKDFKRADYTIDILGLNRESLAASRKEAFDDYIDRLSRYKERRNNDNVGCCIKERSI